MPSEALKKFAEELKTERESKNITPQQIANKTKIDVKFIRAIEDARFDILPDLYVRAFIKEYASIIDLNPEEVINKFAIAKHGKTEEKQVVEEKTVVHANKVEEPVLQETEVEANTAGIKKKSNLSFVFGIGVATVVLILIYFLFIKEQVPEIISEQTNGKSFEEDQPAFEIDTTKNITHVEENIIPNDSLQLSVNTFQRVWVKVLSDNKIRQEGMVDANSKLTYNAFKEFRIVVGNAGNVSIEFNGKQLKDIGKAGEIRNLIINADTVRAYTLTPPTRNENQTRSQN